MATKSRLFTVDDVEALLPSLRLHFETILVRQPELARLTEALDAVGCDVAAGDFIPSSRDDEEVTSLKNAFRAALTAMNNAVLAIEATGCALRDLQRGHVEFLGITEAYSPSNPDDDGVVYLSWCYGEPAVLHYRTLDGEDRLPIGATDAWVH